MSGIGNAAGCKPVAFEHCWFKSNLAHQWRPLSGSCGNGEKRTINPQKIKLTIAYDAFEESMSDEDAEIARRQWMKNTTVESCTLTKVNISMVNKFDNF